MKRVLPLLLLGGLIAGCSTAPPQGSQTRTLGSGHDWPYDPPGSQYTLSTTASYEAEPSTIGPTSSTTEVKGAYSVPSTSSAATQSHADVGADIAAVKSAKGPGAAIDAYAHGYAANPNSALLEEAYIRRMIDFDLPQDAVGAARQLSAIAPDSSLARAVVAFDEARRGDLPDAVEDIVLAAQKLPDDPFVQTHAARILAWYDNTPQKPPVSQAVKDQIPDVRQKLEQHQAYVNGYQQAADFYKQMLARATTQPSGPTTGPSAGYAQEGIGSVGPSYPPPVYEPEPWAGADYGPDYYEPYYPYDYWGWSPFFFGADFGFFNHFYHHDHFRDRGHDHDGRGNTYGSRIDHSEIAHPNDGFKSLGSVSTGSSARFYSPSSGGSVGGQVARPYSSGGAHYGGGYTGGHYGGGFGGHYGGGFGGGHVGGGFNGGGGGGGHR